MRTRSVNHDIGFSSAFRQSALRARAFGRLQCAARNVQTCLKITEIEGFLAAPDDIRRQRAVAHGKLHLYVKSFRLATLPSERNEVLVIKFPIYIICFVTMYAIYNTLLCQSWSLKSTDLDKGSTEPIVYVRRINITHAECSPIVYVFLRIRPRNLDKKTFINQLFFLRMGSTFVPHNICSISFN